MYGVDLLKIKKNKKMVKNKLAVGLSGTKIKKIAGVIAN